MTKTKLALCLILILCASACDDSENTNANPDTGNTTTPDTDNTTPDTHTAQDLEDTQDTQPAPLTLTSISPNIVDPIGGSWVVVRGEGFVNAIALSIGGVDATQIVVISDTELRARSEAVAAGEGLDVIVRRADTQATLEDAVEAWSPAQIEGARVFDAATGLQLGAQDTLYEWQRLTDNIGDTWRVRDGNTTTWLPSTGKFWMVAGWNGYQEPEGFSTVPPDSVYPPENTTDEIWSSPDGVTWTLERPHQHGQFERRHSHNTMLWKDKLWMIGGDNHQGFPNHDVVSSADGVTWTVELGPGKTEPPWAERVLQMSGVYAGKLWTAGGQEVGEYDTLTYHNDVWSTEDGVNWVQVAPDAPGSETRWAGCGVMDGLVEFKGRMWLVGCARERSDAQGHTMYNQVWSTTDGITWTQHAEPPWKGKIWHNALAWDNKLWIMFGFTYGDPANGWAAGNASEVWYSDDGETWNALPIDSPQPGSHAQGIAVTEDFLLFAGGNHSFGFGAGEDKSVWRLVPLRGRIVETWTDRGAGALQATATVSELTNAQPPILDANGLGEGIPGVHFDGSHSVLELAEADTQPDGRSVFWIARAPYLPSPYGWEELGAPVATVIGGPATPGGLPVSAVGFSDGNIVMHSLNAALGPSGESVWTRFVAGEGLQTNGAGDVRLVGVTQAADGSAQAWVDGVPVGAPSAPVETVPFAWSLIGGGMNNSYYGPNTRFAGTLGAVIVLPSAADAATVARLQTWARGRFGTRD